MKKLAILTLAILFIYLPFALSESDNYKQIIFEKEENRVKAWNQAHQIAKEIMDEYDIEILLQEECDEVGIDTPFYFKHDAVLVSTLEKAMGYDPLPDYLSYLQQTLSVYPKDMFEPFRHNGGGLRILLVNLIWEEGLRYYPSGVTYYKDGWYNIYIGLARFDIITFQHELWHAFEARIQNEFPDAFNNWSIFNPEGFQYLDDAYDITNQPEVDPSQVLPDTNAYFTRDYAVANEKEDRATIYETLFYEGNESIEMWTHYPHILSKIMEMTWQMDRVFPAYAMVH